MARREGHRKEQNKENNQPNVSQVKENIRLRELDIQNQKKIS